MPGTLRDDRPGHRFECDDARPARFLENEIDPPRGEAQQLVAIWMDLPLAGMGIFVRAYRVYAEQSQLVVIREAAHERRVCKQRFEGGTIRYVYACGGKLERLHLSSLTVRFMEPRCDESFSFGIRNRGARPCTRDVSTQVQ